MEMQAAVNSSSLHLAQQVLRAAEGAGCGLGSSAECYRNRISDGHMQSQFPLTKIRFNDGSDRASHASVCCGILRMVGGGRQWKPIRISDRVRIAIRIAFLN